MLLRLCYYCVMKESENIEAHFSAQEIEKAKDGFERLAERLDVLWQKADKEDLTSEEEREIQLILNNAIVLDEAIRGDIPEEFGKTEAA